MRRLIWVTLVVVVGLTTVSLVWGKFLKEKTPIVLGVGTIVEVAKDRIERPSPELIPIYPDAAKPIEKIYHEIGRYWQISYVAPDEQAKVEAFYEGILPKQGWAKYSDGNNRLTFGWSDSVGVVPWELRLDLWFQIATDGGTSVRLDMRELPNINWIPVPPGTERNTAKSVLAQDEFARFVRVTTYTTDLKAEEIESYYGSVLDASAWKYVQKWDRPEPRVSGLYFISLYSRGGVSLAVDSYLLQNGQTQVELKYVELNLSIH